MNLSEKHESLEQLLQLLFVPGVNDQSVVCLLDRHIFIPQGIGVRNTVGDVIPVIRIQRQEDLFAFIQ